MLILLLLTSQAPELEQRLKEKSALQKTNSWWTNEQSCHTSPNFRKKAKFGLFLINRGPKQANFCWKVQNLNISIILYDTILIIQSVVSYEFSPEQALQLLVSRISECYPSHRGTVWEYLLEKWRRGVEYGKLSSWHPRTRIHCPPNQTVRVLGVIHKWSFKKAVKLVKNVIVWFGMVRLYHRHVSEWFLIIFFCKTFVFLCKIPIPKKLVFPVLGCFVGYLKWQL